MATLLQIEANRCNTLKSTGPRSAEGKAVSRFDAFKTGIDAQAMVVPGEDPRGLEELAAEYHRRFRPTTPSRGLSARNPPNSSMTLMHPPIRPRRK